MQAPKETVSFSCRLKHSRTFCRPRVVTIFLCGIITENCREDAKTFLKLIFEHFRNICHIFLQCVHSVYKDHYQRKEILLLKPTNEPYHNKVTQLTEIKPHNKNIKLVVNAKKK